MFFSNESKLNVFVLQYLFDVTKEEDEVLISLQQRDMKIHRQIGQGENLYVGFCVFKVRPTRHVYV